MESYFAKEEPPAVYFSWALT